uniref:Uncharacterized protein n=1 Tax=Tetraselmis sp. GSL018 TaxID=582737 RepID=A0A061RSD9_9CHLO
MLRKGKNPSGQLCWVTPSESGSCKQLCESVIALSAVVDWTGDAMRRLCLTRVRLPCVLSAEHYHCGGDAAGAHQALGHSTLP